MDKSKLKSQLKDDGFPFIYEWHDKPGTLYPKHKHVDKVSMYIIDGSLTFDFNGSKKEINKGERFDVPPQTNHTAIVGKNGCSYLVGEMIEGDS